MVEVVFDVSFESYGGVARFGHGVVEVAFSGLKSHGSQSYGRIVDCVKKSYAPPLGRTMIQVGLIFCGGCIFVGGCVGGPLDG